MKGRLFRQVPLTDSKTGHFERLLTIGEEISFSLESLHNGGNPYIRLKPSNAAVKKSAVTITEPETLPEIEFLDRLSETIKKHKKLLVVMETNQLVRRCYYFEDEMLVNFPMGSANFENRTMLLDFAMDVAEEENVEIQILENCDNYNNHFLLTDYNGEVLKEGTLHECFNHFKKG